MQNPTSLIDNFMDFGGMHAKFSPDMENLPVPFCLIIKHMKLFHTVRMRIILISTALLALLLVTYSLAMWSIANSYTLVNYSQNMAFSLSVVASGIENNLEDIDSLTTRVSIDNSLKNVLLNFTADEWTDYYSQLEGTIQSNPAYSVIDRFIITDSSFEHFLQVGTATATGRPLRRDYILEELSHIEVVGEFSPIFTSYLAYGYYDVIAQLKPIIDYNSGRTIGHVYVSVSVDNLLSNLRSYQSLDQSMIYMSLGGAHYTVGDRVARVSDQTVFNPDGKAVYSATGVRAVGLSDGSYALIVDSSQQDLELVQIYNVPEMLDSPVMALIIAVAILVILASMILYFYLSKAIYRPVRKLSKRIEKIQESDFSQDEGLNTDDEFGIIGRGINKLSSEVVDLMDKRVEDERKKLELEYKVLSNQINPHFLYNTFNSIKWMATIQGATGIGEMVTSLSRLMRNISKREAREVTLEEETSFIEDYLVIMRYRYGNTIQTTIDISPSCKDVILPRFTLQPLVENAIFHGIEPRGTGAIAIKAQDFTSHVTIMVADNGVGFENSGTKSGGDGMFRHIGIDNIRQRLEYIYHEEASFTIKSVVGLGTCCTIRIEKGKRSTT